MTDTTRPSWDELFMGLAFQIARRSKDTTKVGAVIVDPFNVVVSMGYNGAPGCIYPNIEAVAISTKDPGVLNKYDVTVHAEMNAILFARRDLTGCTLYCTHHPCNRCAPVIAQTGIHHVVYGRGPLAGSSSVDHRTEFASQLFDACGIDCHQLGQMED